MFDERNLRPGPPDDDDSAPLTPIRRLGNQLLEQLPSVIAQNVGLRKLRQEEIEEVGAIMLADLWYRYDHARYLDNPAGQAHLAKLAIRKYAYLRNRSSTRRLERQGEYAFGQDMVTNMGTDTEHDFRCRELMALLFALLAIMPKEHSDAFVAHEFEGLSKTEGASKLRMSFYVFSARLSEAQAGARIAARDHRAGRPLRPWSELKHLIPRELKGELA